MSKRIRVNGILYEAAGSDSTYHGWKVYNQEGVLSEFTDFTKGYFTVEYGPDEHTGKPEAVFEINRSPVEGKGDWPGDYTTTVKMKHGMDSVYKFLDYIDDVIEDARAELADKVEDYLKWVNNADPASILIGPSAPNLSLLFERDIQPKLYAFKG